MSKLKVGDWVKIKESNEIGKVITKCSNSNEWYIQSGPCDESGLSILSEDYLTKLHIKFKPFEINRNLQVYETRVIKGHEYPIQFMSTDDNFAAFSYCKKGIMFGTMGCKPCITREQSKDWLEHQYATMLCKARGLI